MKLLNLMGWALFAWLIFLDPPYLSYRNVPFPVENPQAKAGEVVRTVVDRCNSDSYTHIYIVAHEMVRVNGPADAKNIIMKAAQASIEPGCHVATSTINAVPAGTPPGFYFIQGYGEVQGMVRTHLVPWRSVVFEVVAP